MPDRMRRGYLKSINLFHSLICIIHDIIKLAKDKYIILNTKDGDTHQIDHLVISEYGLFVIETKSYSGMIVGKSYYDELTLYLGKRNKYKVYNPLHQNYGHIKCLEEVLNLDEYSFYNVVSFANRAKIRIDYNQDKEIICNLDYLVEEIENKNIKLINDDLNAIRNKLISENIIDKKMRRTHVLNIRKKKNDGINKVDNMICPKCGGKLINRTGKYGDFIGCNNYPKCKYIKKI